MTAIKIVLAAILWIAPQVPRSTASRYAEIIRREARRHELDPLLVVALIQRESRWRPRAKSRTHDFGLLQVHVSRTTHASYLRAPERLFKPALNIKLGVRLLALWKRFHARSCKGKKHPWWSHYQHGVRVRNAASGRRVRAVYLRLVQKFRQPGEV